MRQLSVILVLIGQLAILFNKTLVISHFFLHHAEIMEHFCHHATHEEEENCQGICYLKAEMSKDENSPIKNFPVNSLVQEEVVYCEIPLIFSLKTPILKDITTQNFIVKTPVLYESHLSVWRPPTAA